DEYNDQQYKNRFLSTVDKQRPANADGAVDFVCFVDAEEAWFWFITAYEARQSGARIVAGAGSLPRPCEPLDILRVVDRLYRQRRLFADHLRVLNFYGRRGSPPDARRGREQKAYGLWQGALMRIEPMLRLKGIVQ
ncbi:MAG: hypothetical protein AAF556_09690, partial [Pseudomonadota bacterium]